MKKINMTPVEVPINFNYVGAFLTLRCALQCDYCINDDSGVERKRDEMSGEEWIDGINRLDIGKDLAITLEGGEPTMHPDFYNIIEGIKHPVDLLTNLQFNTAEFIRKVNPKWFHQGAHRSYKSVRATFHPTRMNIDDTIQKVTRLQDSGFKVGLFSLNVPENTEANMDMAELARRNGVYFFIKDFIGRQDDGRLYGQFKYPDAVGGGDKKIVMCRTKEVLIAPDGEMYKCHRDLYHGEKSLANICDSNLEIDYDYKACSNFGECNPCDIKLKTNRYLQMGVCSVDIKEMFGRDK